MTNEIFLTYHHQYKNQCKSFFDKFNKKFKYLDGIELKYTPDVTYSSYVFDMMALDHGMIMTAMINDQRGVNESEPVRIILPDGFFAINEKEQYERILHELGHFFTNPQTVLLTKCKMNNSYRIKPVSSALPRIASMHTSCLRPLIKILDLCSEVNSEMWIYKNEPDFSKTHLESYCNSMHQSMVHLKGLALNREFFYEIPESNFFILFRLAVMEKINHDFKARFLSDVNEMNELFIKYVKQTGWSSLKQIGYQSDILSSVRNQEFPRLIQLYEEIFEDFIRNSATFFPTNEHATILSAYKLSGAK